MGINVYSANSHANTIREYATKLSTTRTQLLDYKLSLNVAWKADEMQYVNSSIDYIDRLILSLTIDLNTLGDDVIAVAQEIKREEEARAAAAAAAAARARIAASIVSSPSNGRSIH